MLRFIFYTCRLCFLYVCNRSTGLFVMGIFCLMNEIIHPHFRQIVPLFYLFIISNLTRLNFIKERTSTGTGSVGPNTVLKMEDRKFIGGTFKPTMTNCSSLKHRTFAINCNTSNDLLLVHK